MLSYKKITIIILFLSMAAVFTGCSGSWELSAQEKIRFGRIVHQGTVEECKTFPEKIEFISSSFPRAACYTEMAIKNDQISICDNIIDPGWHNKCIEQMAYSKKNFEFCKKITDDTTKFYCNYKLAINLAIEKIDFNICRNSNLPVSAQEDCIFKYVQNKVLKRINQDPKICQEISNDKHKSYLCLAYIKALRDECDSLKDITYNDYVKICKDEINEILRIDSWERAPDSEICTNVINKSDCYFSVATQLRRVSLCSHVEESPNSKVSSNDKSYFNCIVNVAGEVGDSVCEELKDEDKINLCYYYTSVAGSFVSGSGDL